MGSTHVRWFRIRWGRTWRWCGDKEAYYTWVSALALVGFPFVFLPLYFKFRALEYRFDDKGVSMSWGVLFKKQIYLTYRRIQADTSALRSLDNDVRRHAVA